MSEYLNTTLHLRPGNFGNSENSKIRNPNPRNPNNPKSPNPISKSFFPLISNPESSSPNSYEMDETIAKWIIEFLLRQRIDDKIISGLISSLPLVNDDHRLKKMMLLRRIVTETSNGSVSEKLLELIEIIEALDHEQGKTASDLMKEAYCSVAVDCTVRFLGETVEENGKYMEVVEIVWKNRVCKSEGLVSEASKRWFDDIEAAGKDSGVCEKIWMRNTRNEALKAVKAYLKEAWECLGPSFLELVAAKAGNEVEGLRNGGGGGGGGDAVVCSGNPCRELVAVVGTLKGQAPSRRKHVAVRSRRHRGAKIADANEEAVNKAGDGATELGRVQEVTPDVDRVKDAAKSGPSERPAVVDNISDNLRSAQPVSESTGPAGKKKTVDAGKKAPEMLETPEVERVQKALKNSTRELGAAVNDPLPEALRTAQTLMSLMASQNVEAVAQNQTGPDTSTIPEADRVHKTPEKKANNRNDTGTSKQPGSATKAPNGSNEDAAENSKQDTLYEDAQPHVTQDPGTRRNVRKRSLMEPDGTYHTYAWDDEIENSSSGSPARPRLPSPKVQKSSPLKRPDYRYLQRRKRNRWTPVEEDALREGVQRYGVGNWKAIRNDDKYVKVFDENNRSDVDLKDKWRNLIR